MRRLTFSVAVVVIALLLFSHPYSSQSGASIEGIVLESMTERPLQAVTVLAVANGNTRSATTDAQGHFAIDVPEAGGYVLTASREGMVYARPGGSAQPHQPGTWVQVSAGEHIQDVSLRMVRAGVISGRALDSNGKPYPAVKGSVSLMRLSYDDYGKRHLRPDPWVHFDNDKGSITRMNDLGDYRLYGLQPGDYYVQVSGGGNNYFYPGTPDEALARPVHLEAGANIHLGTIILPAQPPVPVHFHFADSAGSPFDISGYNNLELLAPGMNLVQSAFDSRVPPVINTVKTMPLVSGFYDFVVGLRGRGEGSDLQYGHVRLNVGNTEMDESVRLSEGIWVSGGISVKDTIDNPVNVDGLVCKLYSDAPHVESSGAKGCFGKQFSSGLYQLEVTGMPQDAYIESATVDGKDILAHGLQLDADSEIKVQIRTLGAKLDGLVKDSNGKALPEAVVALVPDDPLRGAGTFYRSSVSDIHGNYQLHGIAPGSYHIFAWTELDGAAYRNTEFMKDYDEIGTPVKIENLGPHSQDIAVLN